MSLEQIRGDWDQLGKQDPLWAVLVDPKAKNGKWDVAEFFATGRAEVDQALARLEALAGGTSRGVALDFGCGVGRLSQALADHHAEVIGMDISTEMLAHARGFDRSGGRCAFLLNTAPDLRQIPDASVDLVFSSFVLQHAPVAAAWNYLREFTRVVRPGGAVIVQVPTRRRLTVKGALSAVVPQSVQRWAQRRLLGYPAPMRMNTFAEALVRQVFADGGMSVAGADAEPAYTPHWLLTRFYAVRA